MANLGLDPVNTAEFHVADMLQWSHLLTGTDTPPHTPHPASQPIDFHIGAVGLQIGADTSFNQNNPDHVNTIADRLRSLVDHRLIDNQGREVEVFDSLGERASGVVGGECGSWHRNWEWGTVA